MTAGLSASGVSKRYGGVQVLDAVSLHAPPGRVTALIGPNGAGKSTLANVVSGFVRPEQGRVEIDGQLLTGTRAADRARHRMGRTFQNLEVFTGMSVLENVMMGGYAAGRAGMLRAVLPGRAARREERDLRHRSLVMLAGFGLEHAAHTVVENLPFGQAKLVEMARVLVMDPTALVLDEPAAGLPPASADALADRISGLAELGIAVLLIEHNMKLIMKVSHHIVVLDHGQVLTEGEPAAVRADPRVIEAYLGPGYNRTEEVGR
jgi:branched-chain amino acid transport system ATP-binding protein